MSKRNLVFIIVIFLTSMLLSDELLSGKYVYIKEIESHSINEDGETEVSITTTEYSFNFYGANRSVFVSGIGKERRLWDGIYEIHGEIFNYFTGENLDKSTFMIDGDNLIVLESHFIPIATYQKKEGKK